MTWSSLAWAAEAGGEGGGAVAFWGPVRPYEGGVYMDGVEASLTPRGRMRLRRDGMYEG